MDLSMNKSGNNSNQIPNNILEVSNDLQWRNRELETDNKLILFADICLQSNNLLNLSTSSNNVQASTSNFSNVQSASVNIPTANLNNNPQNVINNPPNFSNAPQTVNVPINQIPVVDHNVGVNLSKNQMPILNSQQFSISNTQRPVLNSPVYVNIQKPTTPTQHIVNVTYSNKQIINSPVYANISRIQKPIILTQKKPIILTKEKPIILTKENPIIQIQEKPIMQTNKIINITNTSKPILNSSVCVNIPSVHRQIGESVNTHSISTSNVVENLNISRATTNTDLVEDKEVKVSYPKQFGKFRILKDYTAVDINPNSNDNDNSGEIIDVVNHVDIVENETVIENEIIVPPKPRRGRPKKKPDQIVTKKIKEKKPPKSTGAPRRSNRLLKKENEVNMGESLTGPTTETIVATITTIATTTATTTTLSTITSTTAAVLTTTMALNDWQINENVKNEETDLNVKTEKKLKKKHHKKDKKYKIKRKLKEKSIEHSKKRHKKKKEKKEKGKEKFAKELFGPTKIRKKKLHDAQSKIKSSANLEENANDISMEKVKSRWRRISELENTQHKLPEDSVVNIENSLKLEKNVSERIPEPTRPTTSIKQASPIKSKTSIKQESQIKPGAQIKNASPNKQGTSIKQASPIKPGTSTKQASPIKLATPIKQTTPMKQAKSIKPTTPIKTATPIEPATPIKPGTPIEPAAPIKPGTPIEPAAPIKPGTPIEPAAPIKPATPIEPVITEPIPEYIEIDENIYLYQKGIVKLFKDPKRMICDCILTKEERFKGLMGCVDDCLNRMLLIECGPRCPVDIHCFNKRFQKKEYAKIGPFKTKNKGWGVRALEAISTNTFIMEYIGEVMDWATFENKISCRELKLDYSYFMILNDDEIIDATEKGNLSRFINHSCDPNCVVQKWIVNGKYCFGIFAIRPIEMDEEITFDYQFQHYSLNAEKCYCGAKNCRGYICSYNETTNLCSEGLADNFRIPNIKFFKALDDAIEILKKRGAPRNRAQVLDVSRLMLKADKTLQRINLINIIVSTEEIAFLRLFIHYQGLEIIWRWLVEAKDILLKARILELLELLPIPNKTILIDSKIFAIVERWAARNSQESQEYLEINDNKNENKASQLKKENPFEEINKIIEKSFDEKQTIIQDPNNNDSISISEKKIDLSKLSGKIVIKRKSKTELEAPKPKTKSVSIDFLALSLLEHWKDLKEIIRIPRLERQRRFDDEKEADKKFRADEERRVYGYSTIFDARASLNKRMNLTKEKRKIASILNNNPNEITEEDERKFSVMTAAQQDIQQAFRKYRDSLDAYGNPIKANNNNNNDNNSNNNNESNNEKPMNIHIPTVVPRLESTVIMYPEENKKFASPYAAFMPKPELSNYFSNSCSSVLNNYLNPNDSACSSRNMQQSSSEIFGNNMVESCSVENQPIPSIVNIKSLLGEHHFEEEEYEEEFDDDIDYNILVPKYESPLIVLSPQCCGPSEDFLSPTAIDNVDYRQITFEEDEYFQNEIDSDMFERIYPPPGIFYITPDGKTYYIAPPKENSPITVKEDVIVPLDNNYTKTKPKLPLPDDWEYDEIDGHYFYFNRRKQISQWYPPTESQLEDNCSTEQISPLHTPTIDDFPPKVVDDFRFQLSQIVVKLLYPYMKITCNKGRILNGKDFKFLARKITHAIMDKEIRRTKYSKELTISHSVRVNTKEFVDQYMAKFGEIYRAGPSSAKTSKR